MSKSTQIQTREKASGHEKREESQLNQPKEIEQEVISGAQVIVLVARKVAKESHETILPEVAPYYYGVC